MANIYKLGKEMSQETSGVYLLYETYASLLTALW